MTSSAAARMKKLRDRQRAGVHLAVLEIAPDVVEALIDRGWIPEYADNEEINNALDDLLRCWAEGRLTCGPIVAPGGE